MPVRPNIAVPPVRTNSTSSSGSPTAATLVLGTRAGGPGQVTLSKTGELLLNGKKGSAALIETARLIEAGISPFAKATPSQLKALAKQLGVPGSASDGRKPSTTGPLLNRSATATLLLSLAKAAPDKPTREAALSAYVKALAGEPNPQLRGSMLNNLEYSKLPVSSAAAVTLNKVRNEVLPTRPPYDEWFKGPGKAKLEVCHYVMDEFWKQEIASWKKRGLTITRESGNTVELRGTIKDPMGQNAELPIHIVMKQQDENVLRDIDDKSVNMILYSGHSQLGGIVDASLAVAPDKMNGTKLIQLFNCRGKQTGAELQSKYPGAHVTQTWSSAYGPDDEQALTGTLKAIASRGDYGDARKNMVGSKMIQPKSNYMFPDDPRNLGARDGDIDGLHDVSAVGPDRFFDPGKLAARGGANVFTPSVFNNDPQNLSGAKLDHAVAYANTAFFYFAEENRAAPLTLPKTDHLLPGGWFNGPVDQKVRITESKKNGETWYSVSVNSVYASRSREVIATTVLMETQKYLAKKEHGKVTEPDMLRGLMMVGGYLDLFCPYSDTIEEVLSGFSKANGFNGVNYDVFYKASLKDGHEGTATPAALALLRSQGVTVTLPR